MSEEIETKRTKITAPGLIEKKARGEKIVMLTAYDYPAARLADRAGVDVILVGDTVGIMSLGEKTTIPVTMEQILHHVKAVRQGVRFSLLLADMPFGSYQISVEEALRNATTLIKEGGAHAVKLEGGRPVLESVKRMTEAGIPVVGHLGLTPQSYHAFGGNKVQGKDEAAATQLLEDALALEKAGAFALVLELIPASLATQVSQSLTIPTIGIGAGSGCDGQVQVWNDILGIYPGKPLRHTKVYAEIGEATERAIRAYATETRAGHFPTEENSL